MTVQGWDGGSTKLSGAQVPSCSSPSSSWIVMVASAPAFTSAFQTVGWEKAEEEGSLLSSKETYRKSSTFY